MHYRRTARNRSRAANWTRTIGLFVALTIKPMRILTCSTASTATTFVAQRVSFETETRIPKYQWLTRTVPSSIHPQRSEWSVMARVRRSSAPTTSLCKGRGRSRMVSLRCAPTTVSHTATWTTCAAWRASFPRWTFCTRAAAWYTRCASRWAETSGKRHATSHGCNLRTIPCARAPMRLTTTRSRRSAPVHVRVY